MMAEVVYDGTLWAMRSSRAITCFRVQVDGSGRVIRTSVAEFNEGSGRADFETRLRRKLQERSGEETAIMVVADGGASFAYFKREVLAGRYPVPPVVEPPPESGSLRRGPEQQPLL